LRQFFSTTTAPPPFSPRVFCLVEKSFSALGINQPNAVTGKWTNEKFSLFFFSLN
jgi:hypothetical protein